MSRSASQPASGFGADVGDDAFPNWPTYAALRALSTQLLDKATPNGARDFVDVEAFLHVNATAKRGVTRSTR